MGSLNWPGWVWSIWVSTRVPDGSLALASSNWGGLAVASMAAVMRWSLIAAIAASRVGYSCTSNSLGLRCSAATSGAVSAAAPATPTGMSRGRGCPSAVV